MKIPYSILYEKLKKRKIKKPLASCFFNAQKGEHHAIFINDKKAKNTMLNLPKTVDNIHYHKYGGI